MFSFVHLSTLITFCPTIFFGRSLAYPIRSTLSFFVTFVLHFNRSASRLIWTQSHPVQLAGTLHARDHLKLLNWVIGGDNCTTIGNELNSALSVHFLSMSESSAAFLFCLTFVRRRQI
jgi:hypothetical protein